MPIRITKTLFVGLGGTGVMSILRAKQCFIDSYGEIPPMVSFLAIDTDKGISNKFLTARSGKKVSLTENEICFCGITGSALDIYHNNLTQFQWMPKRNVDFLSNLKCTGAGQIRSNGRFLARHNAVEISNRVATKVAEIGRALPLECRFAYATNRDGMEYPTKVNIVGSVAGGTGSGTMLDVLVLVAKTLRDLGLTYSITPWIVLPEIFRHMVTGPASANVYQNAYGALRELDYLYHLPRDNNNVLDFGFDRVRYMDEGITGAYLINNTNKAGVVLQHIDDITDSIGRCMFLPSNELGGVVESVWDNVDPTYYTIRNKKAHYVSAGSAEIVYDNREIASTIANGIVVDLCNELSCHNSTMDAMREVNAWTNSEDVSIQEHGDDVNLLTDSILALNAPFTVVIDKYADVDTISANIASGADAENVIEEAKSNAKGRLVAVKAKLDTKVQAILNTQNGAAAAQMFLKCLLDNIALCKGEMEDEIIELNKRLSYEVDWKSELSALRTGILQLFDRGAAYELKKKVGEYIAMKRDLLRHKWAIQFYTDFEQYTQLLLDKVNVFKINIESVAGVHAKRIMDSKKAAKSNSDFQIYLHADEVWNFSLPEVSETSALFRANSPIDTLVGKSAEELSEIFFGFACGHTSVIAAGQVTIEQKMSEMSANELREIFGKIKVMSSPLWSTNTRGYLDHNLDLTSVFTIGVCDQATSIIRRDYETEFTQGANRPTFASTNQTDRITFFQTQCYCPLYAVNNLPGYQAEAEKILKSEAFPVSYLDEKWNQRMIVESFDIMPKKTKDRVLPMWVSAVVYGFIKYDEENRTYTIESDQGDILSGGILELGQRRDLAFEQFQLKGLDHEVEERIQKMILEQGRPNVTAVIKKAKSELRNYLTQIAQLSAIEKDRVVSKDPAYQMVRDQLEKEVIFLKDFEA